MIILNISIIVNEHSYENLLIDANYWHVRKEYKKAIVYYKDALGILEENFEDDNYQTAKIKLILNNYQA